MFRSTYKCAKLLYYAYRVFYNETDQNIAALKKSATECGVVGIKFLQFIMMTSGFLSVEGKKHFGYVFENCDCHSWKETCEMYIEDFEKSIDEDYEIKDPETAIIGSGSIGQVYKLWHKKLNKYVAVKVRHPNIDYQTSIFVKNVALLLKIVQYVMTVPFAFLLTEFLNNIHSQLDYEQEAKNTNKLKQLFKNEECIIIPEVISYSKCFIIMEYYTGKTFSELETTKQRLAALNMYLFMTTSIMCYDFVHCDLHYGNWKITDDNKLFIYDCGITGVTNNLDINKKIVLFFKDGDFVGLTKLLISDIQYQDNDRIIKLIDKVTNDLSYPNSSDRLNDIAKVMIMHNVRIDTSIFKCLQGFIASLDTIKVDTDKVSKVLGLEGINKKIVICYYYYLLERLNRFIDLYELYKQMVDEDPEIKEKFYDWLDDRIGHRDKDVFFDVMLEYMR